VAAEVMLMLQLLLLLRMLLLLLLQQVVVVLLLLPKSSDSSFCGVGRADLKGSQEAMAYLVLTSPRVLTSSLVPCQRPFQRLIHPTKRDSLATETKEVASRLMQRNLNRQCTNDLTQQMSQKQ
jgi:hypothetical protein